MFYVISNGKCLFNTRRGRGGSATHPRVPIAERFTKGMSDGERKGTRRRRARARETAIVIYAEVSEQLR